MKIHARVQNSQGQHQVEVTTNTTPQTLAIAPKSTGFGSSINGGEFLCLAVATCYCNDVYREAAKRGIHVVSVEVEVTSEFGAEGEPATQVHYDVKIQAHASEEAIQELGRTTDRLAEIQNTLRTGVAVLLNDIQSVSIEHLT